MIGKKTRDNYVNYINSVLNKEGYAEELAEFQSLVRIGALEEAYVFVSELSFAEKSSAEYHEVAGDFFSEFIHVLIV